jgi:hypothetical protein
MKKIKLVASVIVFVCLFQQSFSQIVNFSTLKKAEKHIATFTTGLEYGLVFGAGYGYQLKSKRPIILNAEFSIPSGENMFDDFKTKLGGQINFYQLKSFHFTGKVQGIYRRNQNDYVQLQNFGAELTASAGYYKRKWFTAAEVGFDQAIVTHFKHSNSYKQIYQGVQDGWYEPATGGNFYLGLQTGYSFKRSDIYLKGGTVSTQNFSKPMLPFYAQLGYTIKFRSASKRL